MSKMVKLLLAAAIAVVALGVAVSTAGAFTAEVSPSGAFSSPSTGKVTFGEGATKIECNLTLSGSLDAGPITLAEPETFGLINRVETANCTGGEVVGILARTAEGRVVRLGTEGTSWPLNIHTILGTPPNALSGFDFYLVGSSFKLEGLFGVECLYEPGTERGHVPGAGGLQEAVPTRTAGVYTTGVQTAEAEIRLPRHEGNFLCPSQGGFTGTFTVEPTQTVTVR